VFDGGRVQGQEVPAVVARRPPARNSAVRLLFRRLISVW
jgi:hypothetical protein